MDLDRLGTEAILTALSLAARSPIHREIDRTRDEMRGRQKDRERRGRVYIGVLPRSRTRINRGWDDAFYFFPLTEERTAAIIQPRSNAELLKTIGMENCGEACSCA